MKRFLCIAFALLTLFVFAACGKQDQKTSRKKDQVLSREGQSAQYGDLRFTYEEEIRMATEKAVDDDSGMRERSVYIRISCKNNGDDILVLSAKDFRVYVDGEEKEQSSRDSVEIMRGRSGEITLCADFRVPDDRHGKVEFDYIRSEYGNRWGKITFSVKY